MYHNRTPLTGVAVLVATTSSQGAVTMNVLGFCKMVSWTR
jgi:hypothetical protein